MIGQTSAGLTWPVKTHEMTVITSPVNTRNLTGTYEPGYDLHTISDVDHGHHGMTMQHKLHNQRGSQIGYALKEGNVSQREEDFGKIKLHHLHCHSELHALTRDCLPLKISPCEVLNKV